LFFLFSSFFFPIPYTISESDLQPAVNIGLFAAWRRAQDRCTWKQFMKTATFQAGHAPDDGDDDDDDDDTFPDLPRRSHIDLSGGAR